jgi:hypothetical protein
VPTRDTRLLPRRLTQDGQPQWLIVTVGSMGYYAILDRAPKGGDEHGEMWLRRHDEYDA